MFDFGSLFNPLAKGSPISALIGDKGLLSNPTGAWDSFQNGETNTVNKQIADQNLQFQQETQDYNRALQEKIFEREDTAYQRTAADMAAAGINPLMMSSTNGAGQALPETAKHNDQIYQGAGIAQALPALMEILNSVDQVKNNGVNRDLLQSQEYMNKYNAQSVAIDNLIRADKNDISFDENGVPFLNRKFGKKEQDFDDVRYTNENATAERNQRENEYQIRNHITDNTNEKVRFGADIADQINTEANIRKQESNNSGFLDAAKNTVGDYLSSGMKAIDNVFDRNAEALENVTNDVIDGAKKAGSKVKQKAKSTGSKIKNGISNTYKKAKKFVEDRL